MKKIFNFLSKLIVGVLAVGLGIGLALGTVVGLIVLAREFASDDFINTTYIIVSILGGFCLLVMCYIQGEEILEPNKHKDKYAYMKDEDLEDLSIRIINEIEYRSTK